jgi:hypothetical protein
MFSRKESGNRDIDIEIDRAFRELKTHTVGTQEYVKLLDIISKLYDMKEDQKPSQVSKDTLAVIGANLLGILMIIKHEHVGNFISSRAFSLIRLR